MPPFALALAAIIPVVIILGSQVAANALTKIISFAALGIYLAFMMVVLAALRARLMGWSPTGKFQLGRWGLPINVAALAYQLLAAVNMAWPRTRTPPGTTTTSCCCRWRWSSGWGWCTSSSPSRT